MEAVTLDDRKKELQVLLAKVRDNPSQDWTHERQRIVVLQQMVHDADRNAHKEEA